MALLNFSALLPQFLYQLSSCYIGSVTAAGFNRGCLALHVICLVNPHFSQLILLHLLLPPQMFQDVSPEQWLVLRQPLAFPAQAPSGILPQQMHSQGHVGACNVWCPCMQKLQALNICQVMAALEMRCGPIRPPH
ncbi:hypothetical protein HaLaN_21841 [Haematococcus lacustris]|uniref:Uncharacterized protein n=1 Tax=Haematococcus lacustris TaxID=44745 RepID=A0A699ZPE9_HAELA|nr:hypothetical protein HaLaN_21841 [Haematococcus lacustris]